MGTSNIHFFSYILIIVLVQNSQADVCQTCLCSNSDDVTLTIDCHKAKFVNINVLRFDLLSVKYNGTLSSLDLSENNIANLPADIFENLRYLREINLSSNLLEEMHSSVLKNLNKLEILNLSNNRIKTIELMTLPSLWMMDLSHNNIEDIGLEFHKSYLKLTDLKLSHNKLSDTMNGTITLLRNLKYLDLSYNDFHLLDSEDFHILSQLISLNLSHNKVTSLSKQTFSNSLLELNIGFNLLTEFPISLSNIQVLNIEYNNIKNIENKPDRINELKYLNISGNSLSNLSDSKMMNLKTLDLSYNNFTSIPKNLSKDNYPALETLLFNGNPISEIEFSSILSLKSLQICNISNLESIDRNSFKKISNFDDDCLNITMTDNRKLSFIDAKTFADLNLCFLDLKNNHFTYFASNLSSSGLKAKFGVDLEGNPFHCDCSLQWLLDEIIPWLYKTNLDLLNNLRCASPKSLKGKRMVHWYKWEGQVLCTETQMYPSRMKTGTFALFRSTNSITLHTSKKMLVVLLVAVIVLIVLVLIGILITKKLSMKHSRVNRRF